MPSIDQDLQQVEDRTQSYIQTVGHLTDLIPIPIVSDALKVARKIFESVQTVEASLSDAAELAEKVYEIVTTVVTVLEGRAETDLSKGTKSSLDRLASDLSSTCLDLRRIEKRLNKQRLSSLVKAAIGYGDNAKLIAACSARLDWALDAFQLEAEVRTTCQVRTVDDMVANTGRQQAETSTDVVAASSEGAGLQAGVRGALDDFRELQKQVLAVQHGASLAAQRLDSDPISSLPSSTLPTKPSYFRGRDEVVSNIVHRIVHSSPEAVVPTMAPRLGILGTGGIGKTAVASAVIQSANVVEYFGDRRHWAQCELAITVGFLLEIVARAFGIEQASSDRLQDITSYLNASSEPRLLVLDNFETPIDLEGCRTDVLDILCALSEISHLTIIITMRGTLPKDGRLEWTKPELPPLDVLSKEAATQLYTDIHPAAADDPKLDALLVELGYLPLAIRLVAAAGLDGESPTELLERWKTEGAVAADRPGGDRRSSLEKSIELSLGSNQVKSEPQALELLSVFSVLPGGIRSEFLAELAPGIITPTMPRTALLRASLIYGTGNGQAYNLLPPIRTYVARRYPLTPIFLEAIRSFYVDFMRQNNIWRGKEYIDQIALEEVNIEAVLLKALQGDASDVILETSNRYGQYQRHAQQRLDVIKSAIESARRQNRQSLLLDCLLTLAYTYFDLKRFKDARPSYEAAVQVASSLDDLERRSLALAALGAMDVQDFQDEEGRQKLKQAGIDQRMAGKAQPEVLGAELMADLSPDMQNKDAVLNQLLEISEMDAAGSFQQGNYLRAACAITAVAQVYRAMGNMQRTREALEWGRGLFLQCGARARAASITVMLFNIFPPKTPDNYRTYTEELEEAKKAFEECNDQAGIADCLSRLGDLAQLQHDTDTARFNWTSALAVFEELGDRESIATCTRSLGVLEEDAGHFDAAFRAYTSTYDYFRLTNDRSKTAHCLEDLGRIAELREDWAEGKTKLEAAMKIWREVGAQKQLAQCEDRMSRLCTRDLLAEQLEWAGNADGTFRICRPETSYARRNMN